jgi:hypothetical protein
MRVSASDAEALTESLFNEGRAKFDRHMALPVAQAVGGSQTGRLNFKRGDLVAPALALRLVATPTSLNLRIDHNRNGVFFSYENNEDPYVKFRREQPLRWEYSRGMVSSLLVLVQRLENFPAR